MRVVPLGFEGCFLIELEVHLDSRGSFLESFSVRRYIKFGLPANFVQDNIARSEHGVLRGLHFQVEHPIGHLIQVTTGRIFDVGLDLRRSSATFGKYISVELCASQNVQLYLAPGIAHGYCTLSEVSEVHYKCTEYYYPGDEGGVLWSDPELAIDWPIVSPKVSWKDAALPHLRQITPSMLPSVQSQV